MFKLNLIILESAENADVQLSRLNGKYCRYGIERKDQKVWESIPLLVMYRSVD